MSTTYSSNVGLGTPAANDSGWNAVLDANRALMDSILGNLAVRPVQIPSTSLNVKVAAGVYQKNDGTVATYAGTASQAIAASSTKYLYLTEGGTLTVGSAWPSTGTYVVRLAVIITGISTITSITPYKFIPRSVSS